MTSEIRNTGRCCETCGRREKQEWDGGMWITFACRHTSDVQDGEKAARQISEAEWIAATGCQPAD